MIPLEEVMTVNPKTLSRFHTLADARLLMQQKGFRHLPIVDEEQHLIGLVTQRTVLSHGISSQDIATTEELQAIEKGTLLADIMTTQLATLSPQDNVIAAAHLIHKNKYGCIPLVDSDNKLLGIITDSDFVAISIHLLTLQQESEPEELN